MKQKKLIPFILLLLSACNTTLTGYEFTTTAIYRAPESGILLKVTSLGKVEAGNDTGKGASSGLLIFGTPADTLFFENAETSFTKLRFKDNPVAISDPIKMDRQLITFFDNINYPIDKNEITELAQIMAAINSGTKGTYMQGQTDYIEVIEVNFNRE